MRIAAIGLALLLSACGGGGGGDTSAGAVANNTSTMTGTWLGRATSTTYSGGYVDIKLVITQQGSDITGNFMCTNGTMNCVHADGYVSGTVNGASFNAVLNYPDTHTCVAFNGSFSGSALDASYSCNDPLAVDSGTWHAMR